MPHQKSTFLAVLASLTALSFSSSAVGHARPRNQAGLGKVLTTKDGGQIFGFDINQLGDDGLGAGELRSRII